MGDKGASLTDLAHKSAAYIVESLSDSGNISSKKMFGGFGIFEEKTMFALVNSQGDVFFKANESTIPIFEEEGSVKHGRMPYYQVPDKIINDKKILQEWAKTAITIAHNTKK